MKNNKMLIAACMLALALAIVALSLLIAAGLNKWAGTPQGYISVSASGVAYAVPDLAVVSMTANGTGITVQDAVTNMSSTLSTLNSTLYEYVGGNMSRISTSYYNTYKTYNSITYTAVEGISVTLQGSSGGAFLANVSRIPNVYVTGIVQQLSAGQAEQLRSDALRNALANATAQAGSVAPSPVRLTNVSVSSYSFYPYTFGASSSLPKDASVTVYPGMGKVTETISAIFSYG